MDLHDGSRADVESTATTASAAEAPPVLGAELDLEAPLGDALEQRADLEEPGDDPLPGTPPGSPLEVEPADLQEQAQSVGTAEDDYR